MASHSTREQVVFESSRFRRFWLCERAARRKRGVGTEARIRRGDEHGEEKSAHETERVSENHTRACLWRRDALT